MKTLIMLIVSLFAGTACAQERMDADIRMHHGTPRIHLDGQPVGGAMYAPTSYPFMPEQVGRFVEHDMDLYLLILERAEPESDFFQTRFWHGDTISSEPLSKALRLPMEEQAGIVIEGDPDARFLIRTYNFEPQSWRELHPQEYVVTEEGERLGEISLASDLFWESAAKMNEAVMTFIDGQPWGWRVAGMINYLRHEGSHGALLHGWMYDHSDIMKAKWRAFLRDKYESDAALREAWGDESVTLAEAPIPTDRLRGPVKEVSNLHYWQPASGNQRYHDYVQLQTQLFHKGMRTVMAGARRGSKSQKRIYLFDTFKQPMSGWENLSFFDNKASTPLAYHDMLAGAGNVHFDRIFDAEGFDGLVTPHDYQARGLGGVYQPEGPADTVVLRQKYFLTEMDMRTWTGSDKGLFYSAMDMKEFDAITWRNLSDAMTRGYGTYFMDLFTDWFAAPEMHETIARQVEVLKASKDWPHHTVPGIAMIIDDAASLDTNGNGAYHNLAIMWEMKTGLARCGVPVRIYMLSDLALDDFPEHRVFYFPNLYRVTDERLAMLKEKVFRDGNVVLWGPGSGITDGETMGPEHAKKLTGFEFAGMVPSNYSRRVQIHNYESPITQFVDEGTIIGDTLPYGPVLYPSDGVSLGQAWTKSGKVQSGISVKTFGRGARGDVAAGEQDDLGAGDWASVFTTALPIPADLWRGLATYGGAHIYMSTNDVVLASRHMVAVHSIRSGRKTIALPEAARVIDLITGEVMAEKTTTIEFDLEAPATAVFRLEPAASK